MRKARVQIPPELGGEANAETRRPVPVRSRHRLLARRHTLSQLMDVLWRIEPRRVELAAVTASDGGPPGSWRRPKLGSNAPKGSSSSSIRGSMAGVQAIGHIVENAHVAEQCIALEHKARPLFLHGQAGRVLPVEQSPAGCRKLQPATDARKCGLARTRTPR